MTTKVTGDMGETIASRFLARQGFAIIARNYRKKWGELDIVALKDGMLHFFEVKTTTLSHGWGAGAFRDTHRPEENVHQAKVARLRRTVMTFLAETNRNPDAAFHFHVLAVYINMKHRKSRIFWIKNVVL